jgi:serine phosphatase RsbU (regulator of sigma subunit)/CheY-like chemotaxis protein
MLTDRLKILLLEDSVSDVILLERLLHKSNVPHTMQVVDTEADFRLKLDQFQPDLVLSDHALPAFNSMEALQIVREKGLDIPFILVTGAVSEEFAVNCIKAGADDYILKDRLFRLPTSIEKALSSRKIGREKQQIESLHLRLSKTYAELAEKNRNITESIRYAKCIQQSMLPGQEALGRYFPRSFIINKPKDMIGGDFYWFTERDGLFFIAVADCTGHGVPGALISMIGFNLLNEIVQVRNTLKTDLILEELGIGIQKVLRQGIPENSSNDGMDIALCSIDRVNHQINFSGANRPFFFKKGREFKILRGIKSGIGGKEMVVRPKQESHQVSYSEGDMIYLCTDGYADQFGGKHSKKMMNRNLIKILQASHSFDIFRQHELMLEWLEKWKGKLEQTDDILIVGLEL